MEENNLDGLIAQNIGDLEAALARVNEEIDPKINAAAWDALKLGSGPINGIHTGAAM